MSAGGTIKLLGHQLGWAEVPAVYRSYLGKPAVQPLGALMTVRDWVQAWPLLAEEEATSPTGKPSSVQPLTLRKGSPLTPGVYKTVNSLRTETTPCLSLYPGIQQVLDKSLSNEYMNAYQA